MFFLVNPLLLQSRSFLTMSHGVGVEEEEEGVEQGLCRRRRSLATSIPLSLSHPLPQTRYTYYVLRGYCTVCNVRLCLLVWRCIIAPCLPWPPYTASPSDESRSALCKLINYKTCTRAYNDDILSVWLSLQPTAPQQGVVNPPTLPGADNLDRPPGPRSSFPPPPASSGPPPPANDTAGDMDFDDLTRRFEELKRRK